MTEFTPIEQSVVDTGRRHFKVEPDTYDQMSAGVDAQRGYPHGAGTKAVTERGLPPCEAHPIANDGSGYVLVSLETWRFTEADDAMMAPALGAGLIVELTHAEYVALKPVEEAV